MLLKNVRATNPSFDLVEADISLESGRIRAIAPYLADGEAIDLAGLTVVPGFVDIHIHGCVGADACDGTREALSSMAAHLVTKGVTSFCPTTMTVSPEQIRRSVQNVKDCMDNPPEGAAILGVNMEGPYISVKKKGAQQADFVRIPDADGFEKLFHETGGVIRLVEIAPECEGAPSFIERASKLCTVSLAHSEADYDIAMESFAQGITQATHLFNAMTGFTHREPGAVGAVFDHESVRGELICDGFHIHPAALRTAFRLLGEDRAMIVSDSMRAAGLPDGESELGGQKVFVSGGAARLADGTLAGSTTNILTEVRNLLSYGIPFRQVIRAATINPATSIRCNHEVGSLEPGKRADLLAFDAEMNLRLVIARGKIMLDQR